MVFPVGESGRSGDRSGNLDINWGAASRLGSTFSYFSVLIHLFFVFFFCARDLVADKRFTRGTKGDPHLRHADGTCICTLGMWYTAISCTVLLVILYLFGLVHLHLYLHLPKRIYPSNLNIAAHQHLRNGRAHTTHCCYYPHVSISQSRLLRSLTCWYVPNW